MCCKIQTKETIPPGTRSIKAKQGRTYEDFPDYMEEHKDIRYGEIDTVIGTPVGKVIMTIHFVSVDFTVGILLDSKTAAEESY